MLRKAMEIVAGIFMEIMTLVFTGMIGMCINDILYENIGWWHGEDWQALIVAVIGCMVLRHHARLKKEEALKYWEIISPRVDHIITVVNNVAKCDEKENKEDKVA